MPITKTRRIVATSLICIALALTGCVSGGSPEADGSAGEVSDSLFERTIRLTDGRVITCIVYSKYQGGGLSCDWSRN